MCASRDAECTFEVDRQALLGVIEASFGTLRAFDAVVNPILKSESSPASQACVAVVEMGCGLLS